MSSFFLVGGIVGFSMTFVVVFLNQGQIDQAIRDGMIGCLVMAFLFANMHRVLTLASVGVMRKRRARRQQEEIDEQ